MRAFVLRSCAASFLLLHAVVCRAQLTNTLSADQVACDERQLERLSLRLAVSQPHLDFAHPSLLFWRSGPGGSYAGLAVQDGINGGSGNLVRAESQLAFDFVTVAVGDPLNPANGLLPRAALVRRDADSNATPTGSALFVTAALEPVATNPFMPLVPISVNTLAPGTPGASATSSASGRGIVTDDLTSSCENLLTRFDEKVFTILSRTVRVAQCALSPGPLGTCNPDGSAYNIAIFRGADPHTYRANVYFYDASCDTRCTYSVISKVAYEFKLSWDGQGKLTTGQVTVLPACTGSSIECDYGGGYPLFVLPPLWAGHDHQNQHSFDLGVRVGNDYISAPLRPDATINWQALLAASAWN